jgi:hypothetical protein
MVAVKLAMKLLGHKQGLLDLGVVQKPKLGLNDVKPVIHLQRINCLSKHQRVHRQEVDVGSLHPWLAVGWARLTLHEVLRQHPHELVLCGQQLLEAHMRRRWRWWRGSSASSITKLIRCCPSTSIRRLGRVLSEVANTRVHHLSEIACTIIS